MHRLIFFSLLVCCFHFGKGEGHKIITSGGLQGLADESGEVVIPPVYQQLGWSDGNHQVFEESIGYYENGKWGLINIRQKEKTPPKYIVLKPFSENVLEAGINVNASNLVFRGLIEERTGKNILEFDFLTIKSAGEDRLIVSKYINAEMKYGVYSYEGEPIIAAEFESIRKLDDYFLVQNPIRKLQVFTKDGKLLTKEWVDEVSLHEHGLVVKNEGYYGLLSNAGTWIFPMEYKEFNEKGPVRFAEWKVMSLKTKENSLISCDSVGYHPTSGLLIAHVNNTQHILSISKTLFENQQHILKYVGKGFLVTENSAIGDWSIFKTNGQDVAGGFDSVAIDSTYFYAKSDGQWEVYNLFGKQVNTAPVRELKPSQEGFIPFKKGKYWGWMDFQGKQIIENKFDQVFSTQNPGQFITAYNNKWGVHTFEGEWPVLSEYDSLYSYGEIYIGSKGHVNYIISKSGKILDKTRYQPVMNDFLRLKSGDKQGVITKAGVIIDPIFEQIEPIDRYFKLVNEEGLSLIDQNGRVIIAPEDGMEEVLGYSEGYFQIIKNSKHGFVDENGKLRVANRYDDAKLYSEGMAPIKLMDRWGFISKAERLVIQPLYKNSGTFLNDLAIIQKGKNYGLINKLGEEVVRPAWKSIKRLPTGNYLVTDWSDKKGLVNDEGTFVIRPTFDALKDTSYGLIIATKRGKKGVLDYSGFSRVSFTYSDIKIEGDYMIMLK